MTLNAVLLAKFSNDSNITMMHGSQTERSGMRCSGLTCAKYDGRAPSRAQAQVSREAEVAEPMLAQMTVKRNPQQMAVVAERESVAWSTMGMMG